MDSILIKLLNWTWCLPQSLLGLCWLVVVRRLLDREAVEMGICGGARVIRYHKLWGGVSLGPFLFYQAMSESHQMLWHEFGHYRQSLLLGPLYLPLIGLPSVCWAMVKKAGLFAAVPYCAFPTERWADRLARSPMQLCCLMEGSY